MYAKALTNSSYTMVLPCSAPLLLQHAGPTASLTDPLPAALPLPNSFPN